MMEFIERISHVFGGKGYRTYVAAGIAAFVAVNEILGLIDPATMTAVLGFAAALGFWAADESETENTSSS
jgi:hypothetical protein